jgi:hypothetical protein
MRAERRLATDSYPGEQSTVPMRCGRYSSEEMYLAYRSSRRREGELSSIPKLYYSTALQKDRLAPHARQSKLLLSLCFISNYLATEISRTFPGILSKDT